MYKMVCIDLDGTLLNGRKKISQKDKLSLKKADEKGVHIVLATGRIYKDAKYYLNILGIESSIISANGAFVKDEESNIVINKKTLSENQFNEILNVCQKYNLFPNLYTTDSIYIYSKIYALVEAILMLNRKKLSRVNILAVKNKKSWDKIVSDNKDEILKALVLSFNKKKLKKIQDYIINELKLEAYMSSKFTLEINAKGIDKASGVKELAKYYKIDKNEIICIGDNENDLSMIEYAGLGVAMDNAKESVKNKADFITFSNNNFGVCNVVYKYILNK